MPSISAAEVLGKSIYAKRSVPVYDSTLKTVKYTVPAGQLIGTIYSWIEPVGGGLYWVFYRTADDYANFRGSYVKHDPAALNLPQLPEILEKIQKEKDAADREQKGLLAYYIEKYGKWVIVAIVVAIAAVPAINAARTAVAKRKVSGVDDKKAIAVLAVIAILGYSFRKKRKGSIIVHPLDPGEFVPDVIDTPIKIDTTLFPSGFPQMGAMRLREMPLTI